MNALVWYPLASVIAPQYGLPPELICAIIAVESGGNPNALSKAGAVGLMQVMPREAGEMFRDRPQTIWLKHPAINIAVGCEILRSYIKYYSGDTERAIMAYYAGAGNVPRDGEVAHEGAKHYLSLVRGALRQMFPLSLFLGIGGEK
jgi:soluble lytic murein transglycosylase-like protein